MNLDRIAIKSQLFSHCLTQTAQSDNASMACSRCKYEFYLALHCLCSLAQYIKRNHRV